MLFPKVDQRTILHRSVGHVAEKVDDEGEAQAPAEELLQQFKFWTDGLYFSKYTPFLRNANILDFDEF